MDYLNENKFIKNNAKKTLFDNISEDLKEKINKKKKSEKLSLYFRKLYNKENENYDKMIIHINYIKHIVTNIDYNFCIIIEEDFPKKPPKIYCESSDINNINLNDRRDLLYSIIEKKWIKENTNIDRIDILVNIILKKIPEFISRLLFYEENHILLYYGVYFLNEIYNMNSFLINNKLNFFKVMTFNKDNSKFSENGIKYIVITDIYILFFDLIEDKPKNLGKLIFIGEIFQYNCIERLNADINDNIFNIFNEDNNEENTNHIFIDKYKVYIDWVIQEKNYSFIFSLIKDKKDNDKNNRADNTNLDFINLINQKQNSIRNKYKLVMNDYNQMESMSPLIESPNEFNENKLNNLFELEKYFEKIKKKKSIQENQNSKDGKDNILIDNEIYKIYQKIIEVSTINNKIEITFDYLDKIENKNKMMKKRFINNDDFINENNNNKIKENHNNNNALSKEDDNIKDKKRKESKESKESNIINKCKNNVKNENIIKVKDLNDKNNKSNNVVNNKYTRENSVFNLINKINNNIKNDRNSIKSTKTKFELNDNKGNNNAPKSKKEINSILSLVQKFEKK